jgi:hypothetical protein
MSDCPHEIWERESDVTADGSCPICLRAEVERLQAALEPFARKADSLSLSEALGHIEREHLRAARRALEEGK